MLNSILLLDQSIIYDNVLSFIVTGIIGFAVSEIISYYWKKNKRSKVYFYDRRIHHGEIGVLLLGLLFAGKILPVLSSFIVGMGLGLINDDQKDFKKWFKFKKKINTSIIKYDMLNKS
jgi:hypothetical protein